MSITNWTTWFRSTIRWLTAFLELLYNLLHFDSFLIFRSIFNFYILLLRSNFFYTCSTCSTNHNHFINKFLFYSFIALLIDFALGVQKFVIMIFEFMRIPISLLCETQITIITFKRFEPGMISKMRKQSALIWIIFKAYGTLSSF
jgi:hypothetical protein